MRTHGRDLRGLACVVALLLFCSLLLSATPRTARADEPTARGKIQIRYSREGASYDVYRIFDLVQHKGADDAASEDAEDAQQTAGQGGAQSTRFDYVIRHTLPAVDGDQPNPWWSFLTTHGPDGAKSKTPYAVLSSEKDSSKRAAAYFVLADEPMTEGDIDDYHVVTLNESFVAAVRNSTSSVIEAGESRLTESDDDQTVRAFTQAALKWAAKQGLGQRQGYYVAVGRETSGSVTEDGADARANVYQYSGDTAFVGDLPLGYYLLGTASGTLCSLTPQDSSVFMYDRNDKPELFMQVRAKGSAASRLPLDQWSEDERHNLVWSEDYLVDWAYKINVNVGDYVQFKTVVVAKAGINGYRLHDVMEAGLTFVDDDRAPEGTGLYDDANLLVDGAYDYSPHVYLYNQATDATYEIPRVVGDKTNGVVRTPAREAADKGEATDKSDAAAPPTDGCDFELELIDAQQDKGTTQKMTFAYASGEAGDAQAVGTVDVTDWDRIVVTYWARVDEGAVVFGSDKTASQVAKAKDLSTVRDSASGTGKALPVQTHTKTDGNNRNTNSVVLAYGDGSHTTWARAEVATYQFDVSTVVSPQPDPAPQADAEPQPDAVSQASATYSLYRALGEDELSDRDVVRYEVREDGRQKTFCYDPNDPITFVTTESDATYAFATATRRDAGDATVTSLRASGKAPLNVRGIEAGTYVLVQSEPPDGCQNLAHPVVVTIHDEAYLNTDIVENNNPGSRHSNAVGDITVTSQDAGGIAQTDVLSWSAAAGGGVHVANESEGNPATAGAFPGIAAVLVALVGAVVAVVVVRQRR